MPIVQVQVAEKADPVLGKKRGRIKDTNGLIYQIPPALLGLVKVGNSYSLDYKDDEYNGAKFRVIESLSAIGGLPIGSPPQAPSYQPQQSRPIQQAVQPDIRAEDIATLAVAKPQLEKMKHAGDIEEGIHILVSSCKMWRGFKKWQASVASDMNDEIPEFPGDR